MIGEHARISEAQRLERLGEQADSGVDFLAADRNAALSEIDAVEAARIVDQRSVAAGAHVSDDLGRGGVDVGGGFTAAEQRHEARFEIRRLAVEEKGHLRPSVGRRGSGYGQRSRRPARVGRRRAALTSRHSTSSRTTAPSAKARNTMPDAGSVFSNVTPAGSSSLRVRDGRSRYARLS